LARERDADGKKRLERGKKTLDDSNKKKNLPKEGDGTSREKK